MLKEKIDLLNDRYRLGYHVSAPAGWMNDPNGFCYYKGYYHLFYQHHPYSAKWGPMHWGHARSRDLVHWESLPIALTPDSSEDADGCFSGSAVVKDDILYLFYTGHHYYDDGDPEHFWQNQNMAYSTDGITFTKYEHNPIISVPPNDNTHHFRDPKVWQDHDHFYMIIGSQGQDGLGRVITYHSKDLKKWDYLGETAKAKSLLEEGFMWECPDFFSLNNQQILLLSPQGIQAQNERYLNLFQTGYFVGNYDYSANTFVHGDFKELDYGHDFYATQTTLSPDGRRLVFGWMAMWESEFPEQKDGWAGALTLPRELELKGDRLWMKPAKELEQLRTKQVINWKDHVQAPVLVSAGEKQVEIDLSIQGIANFQLVFQEEKERTFMELSYEQPLNKFTLIRKDREDARYATIDGCDTIHLRLFIDTSSAEIFINEGESVFTERFYISGNPEIWVQSEEQLQCEAVVYQLEKQAIHY